MSNEISEENYVYKTARLYEFSFESFSIKFLLFNTKNSNIIDTFLTKKGQKIEIQRRNDDEFFIKSLSGEGKFYLNLVNEVKNHANILELCEKSFQNKILLISLNESLVLIPTTIILLEDSIILGVFLDESIKENLLRDGEFLMNDIKSLKITNTSKPNI